MNFLIITKICVLQYILSTHSVNAEKTNSSLVPSKLLLHFNDSLVISTLALQISLFKLVSFARGDVKEELLKVLGYKDEKMITSSYRQISEVLNFLKRIDFVMVNQIFLNNSNEYKILPASYNVEVQKVAFNFPERSTNFINNMMDRLTYKRLSDVLVKNDLTNDTSMLLINAAYLTATWEMPFNIEKTKYHMNFRLYNQSLVSVPMMYKNEEVLHVDDDLNKIKVINMKLASPGVSMTVVIPEDRKRLKDFLNNLMKPSFFKIVKKRMRMEFLNIAMPRFKIKTLVDLTSSLQMLGLKYIFHKNNTGLNNLFKQDTTDKHIYLSKAKQKNFIEVNEMGAFRIIQELKAYGHDLPRLRPTMEAIADRPFYFSISLHFDNSDYWNTEELFTGVYYGPDI